MHQNAYLIYQTNESNCALGYILSMQPTTGGQSGAGKTVDETVLEVVEMLNQKLPKLININQAHADLLVKNENGLLPSMSTVLF